ncbi:hypothetical protein [Microbulbifer thermotolerans]|uniref:Uncharacterized protein n=1 Tax=Microbulbifer thermotolerans TaxID=252514 RepID=A0A143HJ35_MICTH|nr:hypothetical protein [Microbulbifer thermotolerans]AMX01729.1 hypothetical protein A3224_03255 [Microbulbifer thermotolerans]MCX2793372.1 hypothetical protein [Microbulbifer thermotolerans]MCX2830597.1 hypothetical protein [Microbulbifer thermotolerans]MCX2834856.1 hypothetical protein [Microbulbifer thermotolerans]SFC84179.1 hypothetical protein SAMN05660479_02506 [Microbulbifer thermotolerans]
MLKRLFATRKRPYVPGINRPETIRVDLSGNILTLRMPPHSNYGGFPGEDPPPRINIYNPSQYFDDGSNLPEWQREGKAAFYFMKRDWEFYGPPWRPRSYGTICFGIGLWRYDALPEGMSCFNPKHFEQICLRNLWYTCPACPSLGEYRAPVHWRQRQEAGATWLYFERHRDYSHDKEPPPEFMRTYRDCYLRIPLDDRYGLDLNFGYIGYAPVDYCLANMNALRNAVLDSVQLELSATAKERLEEAKHKWPDARGSEHRDPEPWIYPEWRYGGKGEENIIVVNPGSPPPELTP